MAIAFFVQKLKPEPLIQFPVNTMTDYIDIPLAEFEFAISELTRSDIKVWLYLTKNKNKTILSSRSLSAEIASCTGLNERTVRSALVRLKEFKIFDHLLSRR